jgi:hypothetical protein
MEDLPKLAAYSRLLGRQQTVQSNQPDSRQGPMEVSNLQMAAGVAVLVVVVLCGLWVFADILVRVAY